MIDAVERDQVLALEIMRQIALGRDMGTYHYVDTEMGTIEAHLDLTPEQEDLLDRLLAERDSARH